MVANNLKDFWFPALHARWDISEDILVTLLTVNPSGPDRVGTFYRYVPTQAMHHASVSPMLMVENPQQSAPAPQYYNIDYHATNL